MVHADAHRRSACRLGALIIGACATGTLTGCFGTIAPVTMLTTLSPAMTGVGLALPNGPTVTLVNEADVPVDIRLWVARVDYREPSGFRDQRTSSAMVRTVPPGEFRKVNGGASGWPTGQNDGVVWFRVVADDTIEWYEFARPGPYRVIVRRIDVEGLAPGPIEYIVTSGQAMMPLPESAWIEHRDGEYPISAPAEDVAEDLGDDPTS